MNEWKILTNGQVLVVVTSYVALGVESILRKHHKDWEIEIDYASRVVNIKTAPNSVYSKISQD